MHTLYCKHHGQERISSFCAIMVRRVHVWYSTGSVLRPKPRSRQSTYFPMSGKKLVIRAIHQQEKTKYEVGNQKIHNIANSLHLFGSFQQNCVIWVTSQSYTHTLSLSLSLSLHLSFTSLSHSFFLSFFFMAWMELVLTSVKKLDRQDQKTRIRRSRQNNDILVC